MSISTNVKAFIPPDEKWKKMKAIYDSCKAADMDIPDEVDKFFNWEPPDDKGVEIELDDIIEVWTDESSEGYQLDLKKLPKNVTWLRFYNSW